MNKSNENEDVQLSSTLRSWEIEPGKRIVCVRSSKNIPPKYVLTRSKVHVLTDGTIRTITGLSETDKQCVTLRTKNKKGTQDFPWYNVRELVPFKEGDTLNLRDGGSGTVSEILPECKLEMVVGGGKKIIVSFGELLH